MLSPAPNRGDLTGLRQCWRRAAGSWAAASAEGVDVALEGSQVLVAARAHQQGQGDVRVGEGGQRRVPELVQGESGAADPPGMPLEQVLGAFVGQSSPPGDGADVDGGGCAGEGGAAIGEEQRAGLASGDDAGQQAGGAGL